MVQERAYPDATVMLTRSPALVMRLGTPKGYNLRPRRREEVFYFDQSSDVDID